jgi:hypothetical protein
VVTEFAGYMKQLVLITQLLIGRGGGGRWGRHAQIAKPVVLCIKVLSTTPTLHYLALVWPNVFFMNNPLPYEI